MIPREAAHVAEQAERDSRGSQGLGKQFHYLRALPSYTYLPPTSLMAALLSHRCRKKIQNPKLHPPPTLTVDWLSLLWLH